MTSPLWIVLVDYNGLEDTRKCLASLGRQTAPCHVVVVDNASRQAVAPALGGEFPWAHFVRNGCNGGWAGGNNTGIRVALGHGAGLVVLLNNDTTVTVDFAARLRAAADAHPNYGVLGPVIYFMDEPAVVMTDGCMFNRPQRPGFFDRQPVPLAAADPEAGHRGETCPPLSPPPVTDVDIVNGCCMMIRRDAFDRVGLIDERFFLIHEESDFCLRVRRAGLGCGVFAEGLVWHKGSSSFKRSGRGWQRYYDARNLLLLLRKHQATHTPGRGAWRSRLEYLKYLYYRYAIEREENQPEAADAVLRGLNDALLGRWGPYDPRAARPAVPLLRGVFEFWRGRRAARQPGGR